MPPKEPSQQDARITKLFQPIKKKPFGVQEKTEELVVFELQKQKHEEAADRKLKVQWRQTTIPRPTRPTNVNITSKYKEPNRAEKDIPSLFDTLGPGHLFIPQPYYKSTTSMEACADPLQLPELKSFLQDVNTNPNAGVWNKQLSFQENSSNLLSLISSCLQVPYTGAQAHAFLEPLHYYSSLAAMHSMPACMYLSKRRLDNIPYFSQLATGYVSIQLGRRGTHKYFTYAHRLVATLIHGPPTSNCGAGPFLMHICNHTECLSPIHMVFGTSKENRLDDPATYRKRQEEQHRRQWKSLDPTPLVERQQPSGDEAGPSS
jgi:hypothetical protein